MGTPGSKIAGRFVIEQRIARGGMGDVFRAMDELRGTRVALKVLRRESERAEERFEREAKLLQALHHPAIVRYVTHGRTPLGEDYLAMEWLEGETLAERLARGRLSHAEAATLVRRIADALGFAHARGIVHRDVKPANIVLVRREVLAATLLDFGIARPLRDTAELTLEGSRVGTVAYMSPEQAWGRRDLDARSDVFSLGCLFFTCVTGRKPFVGEHATAILAKILVEEAPRARELDRSVPRGLDELLARLLAKEKEARPPDGYAVAEAIDALGPLEREESSSAGSIRPEGLTTSERRFVTVVLVHDALETDRTQADDGIHPSEIVEHDLRAAAEAHGGALVLLANGAVLATFTTVGSARDQAVRAARAALAFATLVPERALAIASAFGELGERTQLGEAIDRGVRSLRSRGLAHIAIDDATAGLLADRFEIVSADQGLALERERPREAARRAVLGRDTTCVGRARELGTIDGLFGESTSESVARAALITGAPGLGKTRLADEAILRMTRSTPDLCLLRATGDDLRTSSPYAIICDALRAELGFTDDDGALARHAKLRARLAPSLAREPARLDRVASYLGEIVGAPAPSPVPALIAARHDPSSMAEGVQRAFEEWLQHETALHPVVLVIDDAQWADPPSIALLDTALRRLAESAVFVVAFARPEIHDVFPTLFADRGLVHVPLSKLTRKAATSLVTQVLGASLRNEDLEHLVELADGSPFFLEELMRGFADGSALPETVVAMVHSRISSLPREARRVLRAASVYGSTSTVDGISRLLGAEVPPEELEVWIDHLAQKELVERRETGRIDRGDVVFRHRLVREAAYAMLTDDDRRAAHAWAAAWLATDGDVEPVVLAEHWERGERPAEAAVCLAAAAQRALLGNDLKSVIALAERAARAGADGEVLARATLAEAEAHRWSGAPDRAAAAAMTARAASALGSVGWFRATTEFVIAHNNIGHHELARAAALEATTLAPRDAEALAQKAITLSRAAIILEGTSFRSSMLWDAVDAIVDEVPASAAAAHAWVHTLAAHRSRLGGRPFDAMERELAAAAAFAACGDARNAAVRRMNHGRALTQLGLYEDAERALLEARDEAASLGLVLANTWARWALADNHARRGDLERAARELDDILASYAGSGMTWVEADTRTTRATVAYLAGRHDDARRRARDAIDAMPSMHWPRARTLAVEALAAVAGGDVEAALASAVEAHGLLETHGRPDDGEMLIRAAYVSALAASGEGTAGLHRERALARIDEVRGNIGDASVAARYVTAPWEHRVLRDLLVT